MPTGVYKRTAWHRKIMSDSHQTEKAQAHIRSIRFDNTGVKMSEESNEKRRDSIHKHWKDNPITDDARAKISAGVRQHQPRRIEGKAKIYHKAMELKIGRPRKKGEAVHHIDNDETNNEPSNIVLLRSLAAHNRLHAFARRHKLPIALFSFTQPWLTQETQ